MTVAEIIMWGTKIGTVVFDRMIPLFSHPESKYLPLPCRSPDVFMLFPSLQGRAFMVFRDFLQIVCLTNSEMR